MKKHILYRFFEGKSTIEEQIQIRLWMEDSEENKRKLFNERKFFDTMLLVGNTIITDKATLTKGLPNIVYNIGHKLLKVAAIILFTLAGNHLYTEMIHTKEGIAMQTISVPAGQRTNITLPDGTNVWLNARTTLSYSTTFNQEQRNVELNGEGYFEVKGNKEKPFIIHTSKGQVEVLGTSFNIEAYAENEDFETTLMKGSVKVCSDLDNKAAEILIPGTKAVIKNGKLQIEAVNDFDHYRWKEGLICFKGSAFIEIINDFQKYYGIHIIVKNQKVNKYSYTGKFRQTDGVEHALRVLQKSIYFAYQRDDENNTITIL